MTQDTIVAVEATPPARAGVGGARPAEDVAAFFQMAEAKRDTWFKLARPVANPNRWFDALKALGAKVSNHATDRTVVIDRNGVKKTYTLYNVYCMVPAGDLKPHRKPSQVR